MEKEELAQEIRDLIEGEFGVESSSFSEFDVCDIVKDLREMDAIKWDSFYVGSEELFAYAETSEETAFVFARKQIADELSQDDVIDFILGLEDAYQNAQEAIDLLIEKGK